MNSKYWLLLGAIAACATKLTACSSSFRSCIDTRTCPPAGKGGGQGDAGDSGSSNDSGDANASGGKSAIPAGAGGQAGDDTSMSTPEAGDGGDGGSATVVTCDASVDLKSDPKNCGSCGHDCLGGECEFGKCLPVAIALDQAGVRDLATDGVYLYWTASSANEVYVGRRRVDRSDSIKIIASNEMATSGLTLSSSAVYWLAAGRVRKCSTPACDGASDFSPTLGQTCETLLAAGSALFWACPATYEKKDGGLWSLATTASTPTQLEPNSTNPTAIVSEGDNVYWVSSSTYTLNVQNSDAAVWRLRVSTGATTKLVGDFTSDLGSIAVGGGKLYFSSPPTIFATPLPNGSLTPVKFADVSARRMVADEHAVYWTADSKGAVLRCQHSSCGSPETVAAGQMNPGPLAQDARSIYWAGIGGVGPILRLAK